MNPSKRKGTAAESAVVTYLSQWWPHVERRALSGSNDKGDIAGIAGAVVEVKAHKVSSQSFPAYVDEANTERDNAGAELGLAWVKRRGTTDPGRWIVAMDGATAVKLLKAAGW